MKILFAIFIVSVLFPINTYALTDQQISNLMRNPMFSDSMAEYMKQVNDIKDTFGNVVFNKFKSSESKYFSSNIDKEVEYLKLVQPFYDKWRMYADVVLGRAWYMSNVLKDYKTKLEITSGIEKFFKIGDITDIDKQLYVLYLESAPNSRNFVLENSRLTEDKLGIINPNHVYCRYDNYATLMMALGLVYDVVDAMTGGMPASDGSTFSTIDHQTFTCRYYGKVKKYSIGYFYNGWTKKFYEKETKNIEKGNYSKIEFSTTTLKSDLDYISIRVDIDVNNSIIQELYVFQIDKNKKKLYVVDPNLFLNTIAPQYMQ